MVVARRRRRRRPILPVLALLVTLVVVLAAVAHRSPDRSDRALSWLDQVRPVVERSNQLGGELDDLRTHLRTLDRVTSSRRLDRFARDARAALSQVESIDAPRDLTTARSLLVSCLAMRSRAADELRPAIEAALGSAPVADAAAQLATVGNDLLVADRTYEVFLAAVPAFRQPVTVSSKWVADPTTWGVAELAALVTVLRSSASLAPVHDVAVVTVTTDPPATGREGAADVLPAAKALRLETVVANVGNEPERHVTVLASLVGPDGQPTTARQFVDLAPGQRQTVQLGGLGLVANAPMTLAVKIGPVDGETNLADNEVTRAIVVRG